MQTSHRNDWEFNHCATRNCFALHLLSLNFLKYVKYNWLNSCGSKNPLRLSARLGGLQKESSWDYSIKLTTTPFSLFMYKWVAQSLNTDKFWGRSSVEFSFFPNACMDFLIPHISGILACILKHVLVYLRNTIKHCWIRSWGNYFI